MTRTSVAALILALAFSSATAASELTFFQKMELNKACGPDIRALCAGVAQGEGRVALCVRDNVERLSQPCRDTIGRLRADFLAGTDAAMDF